MYCPVLTSAYLLGSSSRENRFGDKEEKVYCDKEDCALWCKDYKECSIKNKSS